MLRVLAGIYMPSSGGIEIHGKVSTLFTTSPGLSIPKIPGMRTS